MDKFIHFMGIDVSKEFFDAVVLLDADKSKAFHKQFVNNCKGIKELVKWLKKMNADNNNTLICLESTRVFMAILS